MNDTGLRQYCEDRKRPEKPGEGDRRGRGGDKGTVSSTLPPFLPLKNDLHHVGADSNDELGRGILWGDEMGEPILARSFLLERPKIDENLHDHA